METTILYGLYRYYIEIKGTHLLSQCEGVSAYLSLDIKGDDRMSCEKLSTSGVRHAKKEAVQNAGLCTATSLPSTCQAFVHIRFCTPSRGSP